jgi:hypothetical protein
MKVTGPVLAVLCATPIAFAAEEPSASGRWQVRSMIAGNASEVKCTFTQKAAELSGTCDSAERGSMSISGAVDGKKVTWSFKSEYNGTPLTVKYEGTLEPGRITGTVAVPEFFVEGEFTATPAE